MKPTGKNQETVILIVLVIALIFLFKGLKGILEGLNIIKDPEEKKAAEEVQKGADQSVIPPKVTPKEGFTPFDMPGDPFNSNYYKIIFKNALTEAKKTNKTAGTILLTKAQTDYRAKAIYDSVGFLYDKTGEAVAQFKKCKYKTQVSQLCETFNNKYKQDCFSWMKNKFDRQDQIQDLAEIVSYVNNLPSGAFIFPKNRNINEITT
jgi:hypothetical protein